MDKAQILQKIGLSKHETAVYLALIELGPANISSISLKTGIHRPLIYKAIPSLLEKKLITESKRQKGTLYIAEPPNRLEALFDDLKMEFSNILPDLEDSYSLDEQKPKVRFLEGRDGTKRVFDDVVRGLKKGDIFYRYSSNTDGQEKRDKYLPRTYRSIRDAKQLQREVITNMQTMKLKAPRLERDLKVMPGDFGPFEHNVTELIYGNKIAFIDYNSETAMIIDSKKIADFQRQIFKTLFKRL
jgi:sugar-specific transcriptional regulator TrmB